MGSSSSSVVEEPAPLSDAANKMRDNSTRRRCPPDSVRSDCVRTRSGRPRLAQIRLASLYLLTTPAIVLIGAGVAMALPGERAGMLNSGAHGLSEVLYAFASAGNNNGSAFAGLTVSTTWYNVALALAMLFGRFLPILFVLTLAGSLARQQPVPVSAGTLPTHRPQFVGLLTGVAVILVALTFFPALALGPLAEGITS